MNGTGEKWCFQHYQDLNCIGGITTRNRLENFGSMPDFFIKKGRQNSDGLLNDYIILLKEVLQTKVHTPCS